MAYEMTPQQQQLVDSLVGMGFVYEHCKKAVLESGLEAVDPSELIDWLVSNPFSKEDELKAKLDRLTEMGFDRDLARVALSQANGDESTAARWLITISDEQEQMQEKVVLQEDSQGERASAPIPREQFKIEITDAKKEIDLIEEKEECVLFGSKVSLRVKSGSKNSYMIAHHGQKDLNADCTEKIEESTFTLLKADDVADVGGPVRSDDNILILTSDGCYVAVEADGQVNSNRSGPPGQLMKWKLHVLTEDEKHMCDSSVVAFESVMHKYLSAEKSGGASAKTKRVKSSSKWKVELVSFPDGHSAEKSSENYEHRSALDLWTILAKNYRLAALRIRQEQFKQYHDKVQQRLAELKQRQASEDDKFCTVCWDNPPDTVILECGHICVCGECAGELTECPVCRAQVARVIKIRR